MATKVLHIAYSGQGGLGTYFMNFVRCDTEALFQNTVIFFGVEPMHKEYESFCLNRGIPYQYVNHNGSFEYISKIRSFIAEHNIEVVFMHTFSVTPAIFLARSEKKWVIFDHTSRPFKTRWNKLLFLVLQMVADGAVIFFAGQERLLLPKKRVIVFPKSIDRVFKPADNKKINNRFTIGMSSRFVVGKLQELIVRALGTLKAQGVWLDCVFAGDGITREQVARVVKELDLSDQVVFLGILPQDKMPGYYQALDAYIHASEGETICYSIMEAQATGLPVLASDVKGINTVIKNGENGILFSNDANGIISALREISGSEAVKNKITRNNIDLSKQNEIDNANYRRLDEFIRSLR